jgi:hypothetical protein
MEIRSARNPSTFKDIVVTVSEQLKKLRTQDFLEYRAAKCHRALMSIY